MASSPSGRAVRELQRVSACFSTTGVSKVSAANLAVINKGLEDAGDKVEDCVGSRARSWADPGGREGHQLQGGGASLGLGAGGSRHRQGGR